MIVDLIAHTLVLDDAMRAHGFDPDDDSTSMDVLAEFAGRACYQSFHRPNPKTATNQGYLQHINEVGHFSLYRHASASFYVTGVSRSLTHELVVHKHLAHSQLSQRYVQPGPDQKPVLPPLVAEDAGAVWLLDQAYEDAQAHYHRLLTRLQAENPGAKPKELREAARAVLPNAQPTAIVVTGSMQAWRQVVVMRHSVHADAEIRQFAGLILGHLRQIAPGSVQDLQDEPYE